MDNTNKIDIFQPVNRMPLCYLDASEMAKNLSIKFVNEFIAVKTHFDSNLVFDVMGCYPSLTGELDQDERLMVLVFLNGICVYSNHNSCIDNFNLLLKLGSFMK